MRSEIPKVLDEIIFKFMVSSIRKNTVDMTPNSYDDKINKTYP